MATPRDRAQQYLNRAAEAEDLASLLVQGIGGTIIAVAASVQAGIIALSDLPIQVLVAITDSVTGLLTAIFGGSADIVGSAASATAESLTGAFNVGPFTFALGVGAVLLALYVVNRYMAEESTTNIGALGTGIDLPTPGFGDVEEDNDDS